MFTYSEPAAGGFFTGQFVKTKGSFGRRKTDLECLRKLEKRDAEYRIERFGGCNRVNDAAGAFYPLSHNSVAGTTYLPFYCVDLTNRQVSGAGNLQSPMTRLTITEATMVSNLIPVAGVTNDGVTTDNYFQPLKANTSYPGSQVSAPTGVLKWSDVKIGIRAPTSRFGRVDVHLVQFAEGDLVPFASSSNLKDGFYQDFMKKYLFNPLFAGTGATKALSSQIKILRTWSREYSPDSADNKQTTGQTVEMNLHLDLNRYCQFRRKAAEKYGSISLYQDNALNTTTDNSWTYNYLPDPRARVYLFICGTAFDAPATTLPLNVDTQASFDLEIRNKWVYDTPYY